MVLLVGIDDIREIVFVYGWEQALAHDITMVGPFDWILPYYNSGAVCVPWGDRLRVY